MSHNKSVSLEETMHFLLDPIFLSSLQLLPVSQRLAHKAASLERMLAVL